MVESIGASYRLMAYAEEGAGKACRIGIPCVVEIVGCLMKLEV